jgi:hypothetical protein
MQECVTEARSRYEHVSRLLGAEGSIDLISAIERARDLRLSKVKQRGA